MGDAFTHLHVHTEYSMLDGASRLGELVAAAAADGQPALGITDHGNMYGVLEFYKECRAQGIKPIIGTEAYMAHEHRSERPSRRGRVDDTGGDAEGGKKLYYHLTLLAETDAGYRNLIKLSSLAFLEGYYYKPRMDWELLERHHDGLIATTGCLGGHVLQALVNGDDRLALERAGRLQDIFGRDNLFVELQDHGLPAQRETNPKLLDIAERLRAPLIVTNDSHYTHQQDHLSHDALLCVQTGALMSDPKRFKFEGDQHYLKSAAEMRHLFAELPQACDNTLWIAERADVTIEFGKPQLPAFPLADGFADDAAYLRHLTLTGAHERWGEPLHEDVLGRLTYELDVIAQMGFSSYFLIVWDLIRYAREHGIRVGPGRGSAAGCAVAYALRITDLDPIRYDLLFERFLNPSRISMPDIDMDFDSRYRDEMIRYAAEKYGRDRVAQIVTFSTIKARAAVRDAARVLGFPYAVGDRIAKAMPPLVMGRDTPLYACLEPHPKYEDGYKAAGELRAMYEADPDVQQVVDVAKGLEGLRRQDGIHAAAVVITREPLTEYLPIQRKPENGQDPADAPIVTQYEMHGVEDLGLLKMDFLGLRNLDVIEDSVAMIRASKDPAFDVDAVPLDDDATLAMLRRGDSVGVFQLEGGPMRALVRSLAPTSFDDVAALLALYRPGPMAANMHNDYADRKNGRKAVHYLHPDLQDVLGDTYGLMIFQEHILRVAQKVAGYSLAEADNLRKACLPKGSRVLTSQRGYVPIERLMQLRDRRVQTIDIESCTSRSEAVGDVWSVGSKPVLRMTTSTGYTIEATAEHPFLVEGGWRTLEGIKVGDLVGVAGRTVTDGGSKVSLAEVELAALLISEGYTPDVRLHPTGGPHFSNTDPALLATFVEAFEQHLPGAPLHRFEARGVTQLRFRRSDLLRLEPVLGRLGLAADKVIPASMVNAPREKVARFLGLYFCADGWADRSGVHYGSKSKPVCLALKRMLLRFGIIANLLGRDIEGHGRHWTVSVADKAHAKDFARLVGPHLTATKSAKVDRWLLTWGEARSATNIGIPASFLAQELARRQAITGKSKRSLGIDSGGYLTSRVLHRQTLSGLLYSERLEDLRTGDLLWDTVVSIEPVGEVECFDFEMANPERPYAVVEDFLVHNCGKKDRALIAKERESFIAGCVQMGYGGELGKQLFDIIEPFADYAFNKSHAYGYGLIAYQTAYLKAHYPVEYLACLLTSVKGSLEKAAVYLAECRTMGIKVLNPDVNVSQSEFVALDASAAPTGTELSPGSPGVIPFGLSAVRNVGAGLVALMVAERERGGPFADFYDFVERVDPGVLNKRAIESLIKAGGFDSLGHKRRGLLVVFEQVIDATLARRREREQGIMSLFGESGTAGDAPSAFDERLPIPDLEMDKSQLLAFEKEMLGLYVSDHPLLGAEWALRRRTDCTLAELAERQEGDVVTVGGVVTGLSRKYTRRGELMAVFTLEDLQATVEVMVFPRAMIDHGHKLADDTVVVLRGRLDQREDAAKLMCHDVQVLEVGADAAPPLRLRLPPTAVTPTTITTLKRILLDHPGESSVYLHLGEGTVMRLTNEFRVDVGRCIGELRAELGHEVLQASG